MNGAGLNRAMSMKDNMGYATTKAKELDQWAYGFVVGFFMGAAGIVGLMWAVMEKIK